METIQIDHAAYQKRTAKMTKAQLRYTIKDAQLAIRAYPENPKAGYYADEINYCCMELNAREKSS